VRVTKFDFTEAAVSSSIMIGAYNSFSQALIRVDITFVDIDQCLTSVLTMKSAAIINYSDIQE